MKNWLDLNNKVIIVTGGASGIGKAIVDELIAQQAQVVLADLQNHDDFKQHDKVMFVKTDVSSKQNIDALVEQTLQKFGRIDGVVNNAGINLPRLLVDSKNPNSQYELSEADFERLFNINQKGTFLLSQAAARYMVANKQGVIINMSSESGLEGSEGQSAYAATKAAVNSLTRSWAKELGKFNVRVVGIAPGILETTGLRTPAYEEALAYTRNKTVAQLQADYGKSAIPMGRDGRLSEVANLVVFLLSEKASYITGVTYNIAGGKSRG